MCVVCAEGASASVGLEFCHCGTAAAQAALRRIEADLSRRQMMGGTAAVIGMFAGFGLAPREIAAQTSGQPLLLTNLRLFDGVRRSMRDGDDILVKGGRVADLPARGQGPQDAQRINCGGRAVIPGLIDAHRHTTRSPSVKCAPRSRRPMTGVPMFAPTSTRRAASGAASPPA